MGNPHFSTSIRVYDTFRWLANTVGTNITVKYHFKPTNKIGE